MNERSVFLAALEIDDAQKRAAYLRDACGDDANLRRGVEELLAASDQAGSFMDAPAATIGASDMETADSPEAALEFLSPSDQPQSLGRLGTYEIARVIGRGGMGVVLEGRDTRLDRIVAVKFLAPQLAANAAARQRFLREAKAAAAVRDEQVVTIYAVEEKEGLPYLVMELIAGMSLQERIDRDGPLAVHEILRIGMQTAAGLAAAHVQGLIHRDIKPANILLENGVERVKITDFGLARAAADASVSQSGIVAGTPQYMSPEQARGEVLDQRSDLFSLGSVLYAMCTGRAPFRGTSSMAVLKRVCDEAPSPIREANADIPDWLIEVIAKLHAKNPSDRYQSAAEVAELLGQRLAELQHSAPLPLLATVKPAPAQRADPTRWKRWAVAAAVLLALAITFGLAEATGVTQVAATVVRLLTPEGTLVVETNDPGVKVTIEGDGGLVITGAGLEEIRLRPGSYKVRADKAGKPVSLDQEMVTITRGGKQVVRVRLEREPGIAGGPKLEKGAFVLLTGKGVAERKFDTLAEAVQSASDGDTIEIRGNGPFLSQPIVIYRALTVRAGESFRPVIRMAPEVTQNDASALLVTNAALVLEGIEMDRAISDDPRSWAVVRSYRASLRAANCRFGRGIWAGQPTTCEIRNCEFLSEYARLGISLHADTRILLENCLHRSEGGAIHPYYDVPLHDASLQIRRSTFASRPTSIWAVCRSSLPISGDRADAPQPLHLEVSECIFDVPTAVGFEQNLNKKADEYRPEEAEAALLGLLQWRGERNLFAKGSPSLCWTVEFKQLPPRGPKSLEDWKAFWGTAEADSLEGSIRFHGGNLLSRTGEAIKQLTPEDFRLRADSPGYRAGKDGKDLGADVDLVGPGPAYERWKQTPEYQEWLKETGQVKEKKN